MQRRILSSMAGIVVVTLLLNSPSAAHSQSKSQSGSDSKARAGDQKSSARQTSNAKNTTAAKEKNSRYSFREFHDLNGIGKFYMGREIAHVMGFAGAAWLERDSREREERLGLLVKSLRLKPGMIVADIGAGSGVISMLMARQLGKDGRVLAVDVQDEMLARLELNAKRRGIDNIVTIKGKSNSPQLKPNSIDLAIMVDVYHELEYPYEMMLELSRALKPGGRIAFVEYRKEDPDVPIKLVHKMTEAQVKKEASLPEFRLKWKETIGVLPRQHIVVFERPAAE